MAGWTNRGKKVALGWIRGVAMPTNFYAALVTNATPVVATINTFGQLTQIAAGNGYTAGGISLTKNATDFDVWTQNTAGNRGELQVKDLVWTASGGPIPASGAGARFLVITDDNANATLRQVIWYASLTTDRTVSDGQSLTLQNSEIRITES